MRLRLFLVILFMFCVGAVQAKVCTGVTFPDELQVQGNNLALNGVGLRQATVLKVNVYVAALYVANPSHDAAEIVDAQAPSALMLQFVRDVGANDLRNGWREGFAKNSGAQLPALKDRIATLDSWMTDVKSGQRLGFIRKPGGGIEVHVDGGVKGTIPGDDFAKAFLSIWLGADPPNPEIKSGLLGGKCD